MTNPNFDKLVRKLNELFMLEHEDLDFGIYRIMNFRRREIKEFIQKGLLAQVREELNKTGNVNRSQKQAELDKMVKQLIDFGVDPETNAKVKTLKDELAQAGNAEAMENEVFSRLYDFFSRYYEDGDFISLRRYKANVYAVPYEGEEVKLHWANADQYYIKSSEYFKNYRFALLDGKKVEFTLREASTEQNNNKSVGNTERRFRLVETDPVSIEGDTLRIFFNYESVEKTTKQEALMDAAVNTLLPLIPTAFLEVLAKRPTPKNKDRTLLEKHLRDYTARNSFDYFIHKDLGKFLNRELDFFIKNEVLLIDDIAEQADAVANMTRQFSKIVAIKKIARKIITFVASLEDFQRSLWLKKKWVTEAQYCITLDRVPQKFYAEIAQNDKQIAEWISLFKIDKIAADTEGAQKDAFKDDKLPFALPLSVAFLEQNKNLVIDTGLFDADFKYRLLAELPDLDKNTEGVLLHSDNFQALMFLQNRYKEQVKCVYIDPPYNTDASPIMYKNSFKDSSWLSLINSRLELTPKLMQEESIICATIDDFEVRELGHLLDITFGGENHLATVVIRNNPSGRPVPTGFSIAHEYAYFYSKRNNTKVGKLQRNEQQSKRYSLSDKNGAYMWELLRKRGSDSERRDSPKAYYPFYLDENSNVRIPKMEWDEIEKSWVIQESTNDNEIAVYPIDENGVERRWRWGLENARNNLSELKFEKNSNSFLTVYYKYREPEGVQPLTNWIESKYSATEHGTGVLKNYFTEYNPFSFPKSIYAVEDSLSIMGLKNSDGIALDYFAGSGTTGHAVINLNREDGGNRKYILVEQGEYFDTVLLPRLKKVVYAKDWKNGSPANRDTGVSHCLKYIRLESYEDVLNNLALRSRTEGQELALSGDAAFKESYYLNYLFGNESQADIADTEGLLRNPFDVRTRLLRQNEEREVVLDVVETFNYLLGLVVTSTYRADGFHVVLGNTLPDAQGRTENVLIVWRNCLEKSAEDLNRFFEKQRFSVRDREFDAIYVNGDHTLPNVLLDTEGVKVRLIESVLKKLMFEA